MLDSLEACSAPMDDCRNRSCVHSWLSKIYNPRVESRERSPEHDANQRQPWRPHNLPLKATSNIMDRSYALNQHGSVAWDRSIRSLSPWSGEHERAALKRNLVQEGSHDEDNNDAANKIDLESSSSKENRFSRQLRRKTRDDRYDTARHKRQKHSHNDEMKKKRVEGMRKDQPSAKRKIVSGEDIMRNFRSPHIHVEHLTVGILRHRFVSNYPTYGLKNTLTKLRCHS